MRKSDLKLFIPELLLVLFAIVAVGAPLIKMDTDRMNMFIALVGLFCMIYYLVKGNRQMKVFGLSFGLSLSVFMLISIVYNGNAKLVNILWIWAYLGVALLLYQYGIRKFFATLLFYAGSLFFVYQALTGNHAADELLNVGSENNISVYCIFLMIIYYLSCLKNGEIKKIPYIPILLVLFIALWTASRAAMLTLGLFFVFVLIYNTIRGHFSISSVVMLLVIVVAVVYFSKNYFQEFGLALTTKIDRYGGSSVRSLIWSDYFRGMGQSFGNFLFGVKGTDSQYPYLCYYNGNTHNAFLMLHSKFGVGGVVLIFWYLLLGTIKALKAKRYVFISLLFVVALRAMFDWAAFPGLLDVIFYFYVIYAKDKYISLRQDAIVVR
ncbi:O-antigen ligase family protein [bacterium]|nr:O-antigen ligase family protein [bacterium]